MFMQCVQKYTASTYGAFRADCSGWIFPFNTNKFNNRSRLGCTDAKYGAAILVRPQCSGVRKLSHFILYFSVFYGLKKLPDCRAESKWRGRVSSLNCLQYKIFIGSSYSMTCRVSGLVHSLVIRNFEGGGPPLPRVCARQCPKG